MTNTSPARPRHKPRILFSVAILNLLASLLLVCYAYASIIGNVITDNPVDTPVWFTVAICVVTFPANLLVLALAPLGLRTEIVALVLFPFNSLLWGWTAALILRRRRRTPPQSE